ncbi:MAG: rod shape-determining protein MreC [Lachnospiraceae bacterium]|nr:rod shape-determining protein MreC [Lachnospiraceae bacterium]
MSPIIKKKGEKFTLPGKYLLFILTLLCTGLIVITFNTNFLSAPISAIGGSFIAPLQEGISKAGSWLSTRSEELVQIRSLIKENEDLKAQIDELTMENIRLQQDRYELTNLRELYDLDEQYDEYEKIGARIIAKDSGNWFHSFVINKGSNDGLMIDMNVMAGSGLVGRIVDVGPNWAKVMSIIDDNSNTSGMVLSTSDNLMVRGDLELYADGLISFEKLTDSADRVVEGDKIVTSNISDKYLPGILIGYISSINVDSNNLTKSGLITPAVDFEHLEEVLVITQMKQTAENSMGDS